MRAHCSEFIQTIIGSYAVWTAALIETYGQKVDWLLDRMVSVNKGSDDHAVDSA
jgi:hypothetical protein